MSLQIHHFKSNGESVTMVGSGAAWDGYQPEINYFAFHAERFARFVGSEATPVIAYQAAGNVYGFRKQADGCHGAFGEVGESPTPITLQEVMEDLS